MVTEFSIVVTLVEMLLIGKEQEGAFWAAGNVYILLADNYTAVFICKYSSSCSHISLNILCYTSMTKYFESYTYQEIVSILDM